MNESKQPGIVIHQILVLNVRFGHRADVLQLPADTRIEDLPVRIEAGVMGKQGDTTVAIKLHAFTPEDRDDLLYNFDIEMAAVVGAVEGEENLDPLVYATGMGAPSLFPFLREAIANITGRGRFGPLWLKPMNFHAFAPKEVEVAVQ